MRNPLIYAVCLWLVASPAGAAVAFVQAVVDTNSNTTFTQAITATTGHALFVGVSWPDVTHTCTVSDGVNTYTQVGTRTNTFGTSFAFYAKNITGGSLTLTITTGATTSSAITVMEFSGGDTTTLLGGTADGQNTSSGAGDILSGSLSVAASSGDAVIAIAGSYYNPTWVAGATKPTGFAVAAGATANLSTSAGVGHGTGAYAILAAGYSGAVSLNAGAQNYGNIIVGVFKAGTAPTGRRRVIITADDWFHSLFSLAYDMLLWRA